jgi:hypothetical protein
MSLWRKNNNLMLQKLRRAIEILEDWAACKKTGHVTVHFNQGGVTTIEKTEKESGKGE